MTEIWQKNPNPKWRPPPSCISLKVAFLDHSYPVMVTIYLQTKSEAIIFIGDRDIAKNVTLKSRSC